MYYTTDELITALKKNKETSRIYIVCNAYLINNEKELNQGKLRWYIQLGYDLLDTDFKLDEAEKKEFLTIHFKYLEKLKKKYKTFEELPIHGLLDRFDLLNNLNLN